jgi:hypothetical protein
MTTKFFGWIDTAEHYLLGMVAGAVLLLLTLFV